MVMMIILFLLFVFVYSNKDDASKRFKAKRCYLPKGIIKSFNMIINGKNVYDQATDSDIKRYKEIRKLTKAQGEDHTTDYVKNEDYDYIKNHYRLAHTFPASV